MAIENTARLHAIIAPCLDRVFIQKFDELRARALSEIGLHFRESRSNTPHQIYLQFGDRNIGCVDCNAKYKIVPGFGVDGILTRIRETIKKVGKSHELEPYKQYYADLVQIVGIPNEMVHDSCNVANDGGNAKTLSFATLLDNTSPFIAAIERFVVATNRMR
jgi:hypothetical protein